MKQLSFEDFSNQFKQFIVTCDCKAIRQYNHPALPGRSLLADVDGETCLIWETILTAENCYARHKQLSLMKQLNNHPQFVYFRGATLTKSSNAGEFLLGVIFDYHPLSIEQWFDDILVREDFLPDSDLVMDSFWRCLSDVITALLVLERAGLYHGQLHLANILMAEDAVKVMFNPAQPTSLQLLRQDNQYQKLLFLSPEEINMEMSQQTPSKINQKRCDMFNCGVIFLRVLLKFVRVQPLEVLENEHGLHRQLTSINKRFGFDVYEVLQRMTRIEPSERPDFYELNIQLEDLAQARRKIISHSRMYTREEVSTHLHINHKKQPQYESSPKKHKKIFFGKPPSRQRSNQVETEGCLTTMCFFKC